MARGGFRPNSGRKPGAATKLDEAARRKAAETGKLPLDFLLETMRNEANEFALRLDAAKAAAPYVHARLSSVETKAEVKVQNVVEMPAPVKTVDEWQSTVSTQH